MSNVTSFRAAKSTSDADEWQLRVDLAAAFRLVAHYNWHEAVANHFSVAVSNDGKQFLMLKRAGAESQTIIVHNWISEVRAKLAGK